MEEKRQLNVRIPTDLYDKVTQEEKPQVEIVVEALQAHFRRQLLDAIFDYSALSFSSELELHNWFIDNYNLLGFTRIIKQSLNSFPDFILEYDGREIRAELETLSSNFLKHKHDPSQVDIVVCLQIDKELPVPIIELPFRFIGVRAFSIRLEDEQLKLLDERRGRTPRSEYVREVISNWLRDSESTKAHNQEPPNELIKTLQEEVAYLRSKLDDALKLLHQEQILHLHAQKQLTAPEKKWWMFWK